MGLASTTAGTWDFDFNFDFDWLRTAAGWLPGISTRAAAGTSGVGLAIHARDGLQVSARHTGTDFLACIYGGSTHRPSQPLGLATM